MQPQASGETTHEPVRRQYASIHAAHRPAHLRCSLWRLRLVLHAAHLCTALGFITFFAVTFVSIFTILIYNTVGHHTLDMSYGYKYVALPAGCVVLAIALAILGTVWLRRKLTGR